MTDNTTPEAGQPESLAETAYNTHRAHGEAAMLAFVRQNLDTRPTGAEDSVHALTVLNDHTAVLRDDQGHTYYVWNEPADGGSTLKFKSSSAAPKEKGRLPAPMNRAAEVSGAPNRDMLVTKALKELERAERVERNLDTPAPWTWMEEDPRVTLEQAALMAPSLIAAAATDCRHGVTLNELYEFTDIWTRETAEENIASADPAQIAALRAMIGTSLQEMATSDA